MTYAFGHWAMVLISAGHGWIEHAGHRFAIAPRTLICSPPGLVSIDLSADADLFVLSLEERGSSRHETWRPFAVPLVRGLDIAGERAWRARLETFENRIAAGAISDADVRALKRSFMDCFWLDTRASSRRIVHETFGTLYRELDSISTLDGLASNLGYTRNHLNDTMRDLTGASLGTWLTGMRMARARDVLATENIAIADVGAAVGYDDAAYFSRAFRRYHGVPPQSWRIAHRPDDERRAMVVAQDVIPEPISAVA